MNPEQGAAPQAPQDPPTPWAHGHYQQNPDGSYSDVPYERVGKAGRAAGAGGAIGVGYTLLKLGAGLKFILPALFKFPFLLSIVANIFIYTWLFGSTLGPAYGLAFGAGFVALLFIHEMGHLIAARYEGLAVSIPYFIPFAGALIMLREQPRDARVEAIIGIGGPITGTLGALATYGLALSLGAHNDWGLLLDRLAYYGFFLNLFNMIPLSPLDGGRVLGAVSKWFNVVGLGLILLGVVTGYLASPILLIILLFGGFGLYRRFREPEHTGYYDIPFQQKAVIGLSYLALLAVLIWGLVGTEQFITGGLSF